MTLRDEAIAAIANFPADPIGFAEAEDALDGLLAWLRDNATQFKGPNLDPTTQIWVLCDLLAKETP